MQPNEEICTKRYISHTGNGNDAVKIIISIEFPEPHSFKRPQVEMMARRWQHHCIEIREAAQQILLGELGRMGKKGRKQLVESWAQFLPLYTHTEPIVQQLPQSASQQSIAGAPATQVQEPNVILLIFLS